MNRNRNTAADSTTSATIATTSALAATSSTLSTLSRHPLRAILSHGLFAGILLASFSLTGCAELAYDLAQDVAQTRCEREPTPAARSECIARNSYNQRTYDSERARVKNGK